MNDATELDLVLSAPMGRGADVTRRDCAPEHGDACDGVHEDTVLVTTEQAAEAVGVSPGAFRTWARRRHLEPIRRVRIGSSWRSVYDLERVYDATRRTT